MKTTQIDRSNSREITLREFLKNVWKYKFIYLFSLLLFITLGYLYLKWTPPVYEVDASILVEQDGKSMLFGDQAEGSIRMLEPDKNLSNEMNILKSVGLIEKTITDLNLQVSYFSKNLVSKREHYKDFPFTVELLDHPTQLVDVPIRLELVSADSYRVEVIAKKKYKLLDRESGKTTTFEEPLFISQSHTFGVPADTDHYAFVVEKQFDFFPYEKFEGREMFFVINSADKLVKRYQNSLDINQVDLKASILSIAKEGEVVEKEVAFVDKLAENYIDSKNEERNKIASTKINFIKEQLESISDSLAKAERTIEVYRKAQDAVNLTQSGARALEQFQQLEDNLSQANLNLNYFKSLLKHVEDSSGINQIVGPATVGITNSLLDQNLLELKSLSSELTRLQFLSGPKSMDVQAVEKQIENTRMALRENIQNLIASTEMTIGNYKTRMRNLERTLDLLPTREKNLVNYTRKTALFENLYNYLNEELARTGIAQAEDLPDIKVINRARMIGSGPKSPKKELVLLLSLLLGFLVPTIFTSLLGKTDDKISGVKAIEQESTLPVLAQIAHDSLAKKAKSINAEHWQTKESIRDLHANIKFFLPNYWKKVISVTSMVPGEGKTFVAANLAMTMASAGNKVLLIDADFRNPSLSRHYGVNPNDNFSTFLNGYTSDNKSIIQTHRKYKTLDFVTTTAASINPHRYLQNPKFEYFIIDLKDEYDHIIIDCPAVGLVSDYLLLFHLADIHLFVLRQKVSKLSQLAEIEKFREKGNVENLYVVLNDVPGKKLKHGYFTYDSSVSPDLDHIGGNGEAPESVVLGDNGEDTKVEGK